MQYKEIKTEKGVLKYRMPNIAEAYKFLSESKVFVPGADSSLIKGYAIEKIDKFLDISASGYGSFDEMLMDYDLANGLGEVVDEVLLKALEVFKKKSS